ncbi:hypothetical protein MATR_33250 [Marivirga tractuosa]|uniref:Uncharacterized protein n=1 Tax=Marivirga tractuosa (strain ATCC 23168 / DSM 4126 / NBRC 15989 / NCIMB 1408 / VKM B-1430 / H-43) TaxID=643867 RepID=E4TSB1_MARTH|nr:hypothetical protein [Marivirga tractuosa]ADR22828.1 hypothetical protein Ftrac_2851 [Marivirga tractuosa DSM 4126]BDD16500.1 hypothetical protein MATR_33250 [Marivirga tractuosa]
MKNLKFPVLLFVAITTFFIACEEKTDIDLEYENLTTIEKLRLEAKEFNVTLEEDDSFIQLKGDVEAIQGMKSVFLEKYNFKLVENVEVSKSSFTSENPDSRVASEPCDVWVYESNGSEIRFYSCCRGDKCVYLTVIV